MEQIIIKGGRRLEGRVVPSGAKNSALPILAATILSEGVSTLRNLPRLRDVNTFIRLLKSLGLGVEGQGEVRVDGGRVDNMEASYDLVRTMRASVLVLGPLVARTGRARVSLPGGCAIGSRPINLHLKGLEALGAKVELTHGYVEALAPQGLRGGEIYLDYPTVTGTENLMMAAALARGTTVIGNAAREPEIVALGRALEQMGCGVSGMGTGMIRIQGRESLAPLDHTIIPDRIEIGTYMVAAALTKGDVVVEQASMESLEALILKLQEAGAQVEAVDGGMRVRGPEEIRSVEVHTLPFPGFPTDMQAQFTVLMCLAEGTSVITETVFENRFMHVSELRRMGASIQLVGRSALIAGVPGLSGAPVMATDLRASACLILAGLVAKGTTIVSRVYHLDRGYERLEEKLRHLGADIERVREA